MARVNIRWKISGESRRPACFRNVRTRKRPAGISEEVRGEVFEEQLTGWYRVPSLWPSRRDLDAFDRRFEWGFHSVVIAVRDPPLLQEEI
jgi:hypothetical protein